LNSITVNYHLTLTTEVGRHEQKWLPRAQEAK
jgi:hypothetical protein